MYGWLYRNALARGDAERAHHLAIGMLVAAADERLRIRLWDLPFANPLGIAAGLDKDARAVPALHALGFGHVEVGTVTLRPQPGNAKPRVWRAVEQGALVNAMGFPSDG